MWFKYIRASEPLGEDAGVLYSTTAKLSFFRSFVHALESSFCVEDEAIMRLISGAEQFVKVGEVEEPDEEG